MAVDSGEHDFTAFYQVSTWCTFLLALYRGLHHGALSFRVLPWSSSRCIVFFISGFDLVHFFRVLSWSLSRCILFYRGLYHGALLSSHRVSTWCTSLYHGFIPWCIFLSRHILESNSEVHALLRYILESISKVHTCFSSSWCFCHGELKCK